MERHLFIVARQRTDVYGVLSRDFARDPNVGVILDRRHGERRAAGETGGGERRRTERRSFEEKPGLETHGFGLAKTSAALGAG